MAFGYGGYLTQSGTDELYAFARTYSPGMARFNENDPVRSFDPMLSMGPHRYVLGYGNPLSYVDPDGRIGIFFDGTWNNKDDPDTIRLDGDTNVARLLNRYDGVRYYEKGIGTDAITRALCGFSGCGHDQRVQRAYDRVTRLYNDPNSTDEDKQIDIFSFSRGSAHNRALANMLLKKGIALTTKVRSLEPSGEASGFTYVTSETQKIVPAKIRFMGLFDSVPALGVPTDPRSNLSVLSMLAGFEDPYGQRIDFSKIGNVRHAVAAGEGRVGFDLQSIKHYANETLPSNAREEYFYGAHSDIGGGYNDDEGGHQASNVTLAYMYREARASGVPFKSDGLLERDFQTYLEAPYLNISKTNDSRGSYEKWLDRQERTVYYSTGSENLSFKELRRRVRESAASMRKEVIESGSVDPVPVTKAN